MKITSISYQAVKNLGNYESERLEASADVEGTDPIEAVKNLRLFVHSQLLKSPDSLFEASVVPSDSSDLPDGF